MLSRSLQPTAAPANVPNRLAFDGIALKLSSRSRATGLSCGDLLKRALDAYDLVFPAGHLATLPENLEYGDGDHRLRLYALTPALRRLAVAYVERDKISLCAVLYWALEADALLFPIAAGSSELLETPTPDRGACTTSTAHTQSRNGAGILIQNPDVFLARRQRNRFQSQQRNREVNQ